MDAFALDSMVTRTRQAISQGALDPVRVALTQLYALDAVPRAWERTRRALCSTLNGDALDTELQRLAHLDVFTPYNPAELRETVVTALESAGGYPLSAV
jgi:hypothetical protein